MVVDSPLGGPGHRRHYLRNMKVILQDTVIGPYIYDSVMKLHKINALRKYTVERKVAFSLKIKICVVAWLKQSCPCFVYKASCGLTLQLCVTFTFISNMLHK